MSLKLVIVGGVAGGATAAARARRLNEKAEIVIFERGEFISFANCGLPYYIGETIKDRDDLLVMTAQEFEANYHVDVRTFSEVTSIDRKNKTVEVKESREGRTYTESYDRILLSPGAVPIRPPIEGVNLKNIFCLRSIPDMDRIKHFIDSQKPKSAVVVGGGYIGIEMAENLVKRGVRTTIVEMLNQVMAPIDLEMAAFVHGFLREGGIRLELGNRVTTFRQNGNRIRVSKEKGGDIDCDMAILSMGVRPEIALAEQAGLEIGMCGGIKVDETMRTSDPNIYAVGDAVETRDRVTGSVGMLPLAGPANKQARIAADNIMGRKTVFEGTVGNAVVKLFDKTIASTGQSEKKLQEKCIPYLKSYTFSGSHASYYPGSEMMAVKLLFSPGNGKILGGQIVGGKGVDKRIDVLSTAIYGGMTVYDLEKLELCYAPPFSSAKDPINIAGFVASNMLKKDIEVVHWNDLETLEKDGTVLVDVRTAAEIRKTGMIDGSVHIPIDRLRDRIHELNPEKPVVAYCAVGYRGYLAYRILVQNGFTVRNLSGGFFLHEAVRNHNEFMEPEE